MEQRGAWVPESDPVLNLSSVTCQLHGLIKQTNNIITLKFELLHVNVGIITVLASLS